MNFYDAISEGYDELYKEEQLRKWRIILDNVLIKKSDRLLDVGCGTAFSFELLDCRVFGIEPSFKLAQKSRFKEKITIGKAEKLPFSDESFDIVTSVTAIHNFGDIEKGLKEMKRVGKNIFVFSVMIKAKKFNYIQNIIEENFFVEKRIDDGRDIIFFCRK